MCLLPSFSLPETYFLALRCKVICIHLIVDCHGFFFIVSPDVFVGLGSSPKIKSKFARRLKCDGTGFERWEQPFLRRKQQELLWLRSYQNEFSLWGEGLTPLAPSSQMLTPQWWTAFKLGLRDRSCTSTYKTGVCCFFSLTTHSSSSLSALVCSWSCPKKHHPLPLSRNPSLFPPSPISIPWCSLYPKVE